MIQVKERKFELEKQQAAMHYGQTIVQQQRFNCEQRQIFAQQQSEQ